MTECEIVTEPRFKHPKKVLLLIIVRPFGILNDNKFKQLKNADWPILVSVDVPSKVAERRLVQLANALEPMLVTVGGIITEVKPERVKNAPLLIFTTV